MVKTHVEEQEELRTETISAFHHATDIDNNNDDDLLVLREKTKDEIEQEDEEYHEFLKEHVGDIKDIVWVEEEHNSVVPKGEADQGVASPKKLKRSKDKEKTKATSDQEFLMK